LITPKSAVIPPAHFPEWQALVAVITGRGSLLIAPADLHRAHWVEIGRRLVPEKDTSAYGVLSRVLSGERVSLLGSSLIHSVEGALAGPLRLIPGYHQCWGEA
jgi:hypothetical protein